MPVAAPRQWRQIFQQVTAQWQMPEVMLPSSREVPPISMLRAEQHIYGPLWQGSAILQVPVRLPLLLLLRCIALPLPMQQDAPIQPVLLFMWIYPAGNFIYRMLFRQMGMVRTMSSGHT